MAPPIAVVSPCPVLSALDEARRRLGWPMLALEVERDGWYLAATGPNHRTTCRIDRLETAYEADSGALAALTALRASLYRLRPAVAEGPYRRAALPGHGLVFEAPGPPGHTTLVACAALPGPMEESYTFHADGLKAWAAATAAPDVLLPTAHGRLEAEAVHPDLAALLTGYDDALRRIRLDGGTLFFTDPADAHGRLRIGVCPHPGR